jgi:ubiquinone/menaquinone biosynthesis C-methylase UbiE
MRLITYDDLIDAYYRVQLKGIGFLGSKLTFNKLARTYSSFNSDEMLTSNWWNIPAVRNRWNKKITGNAAVSYVDYVFEKYLKEKGSLRLLSPGCGVCSNEIRFASFPSLTEITCIDIAEKPLETARKIALEKNFNQMHFIKGDVNEMDFVKEYYDVVMFNSSLHHFKNIDNLLINCISSTLKPDGFLLINEYAGPRRLQWNQKQLEVVNDLLQNNIPQKYKRRYKSNLFKNRVSGPGILRMIFSDPSEAVDSDSIIPVLQKGFTPLEEKYPGGNILMILLKDIAHHFSGEDPEAMLLLDDLMQIEDDFLKNEASDNIFGIYKKK